MKDLIAGFIGTTEGKQMIADSMLKSIGAESIKVEPVIDFNSLSDSEKINFLLLENERLKTSNDAKFEIIQILTKNVMQARKQIEENS